MRWRRCCISTIRARRAQWLPNRYGGNENLEAVAFLRKLNESVYAQHPGVITIAEESTSWPRVSAADLRGRARLRLQVEHGLDARHARVSEARRRSTGAGTTTTITFGLIYAFAENFVLPLSHDEVVHGKGSLLGKMPGDAWQQVRDAARLLRASCGRYPGKKLLFMGQEFAQRREWNFEAGLDWDLLDAPAHRGVQAVVRDCNRLYRAHPALHDRDCDAAGFRVDRRRRCATIRCSPGCARPATARRPSRSSPTSRQSPRAGYRHRPAARRALAGDPQHRLRRLWRIEPGQCRAASSRAPATSHGFPYSATIAVPPLATVWFVHEGD